MKKILLCLCVMLAVTFTGCKSNVEEGGELLTKQEFAAAAEKYQASIEEGKELAESFRGLGICYYEQEQFEEALKAFEQALNEGTEKTAVLYNLCGICSLRVGDAGNAVYYFEEGQKYSDVSEELRQEMAFNVIVCYGQLGEYELAKQAAEAYLEMYPDDEKVVKELEFLETQS